MTRSCCREPKHNASPPRDCKSELTPTWQGAQLSTSGTHQRNQNSCISRPGQEWSATIKNPPVRPRDWPDGATKVPGSLDRLLAQLQEARCFRVVPSKGQHRHAMEIDQEKRYITRLPAAPNNNSVCTTGLYMGFGSLVDRRPSRNSPSSSGIQHHGQTDNWPTQVDTTKTFAGRSWTPPTAPIP